MQKKLSSVLLTNDNRWRAQQHMPENVHTLLEWLMAEADFRTGSSIPSYLRTTEGSHEFRVMYDGQAGMCRLCGQTGHFLRTCQNRRSAPRPCMPEKSSSTERNSGAGSHRTDSPPKAPQSLNHASALSETASDSTYAMPQAPKHPSDPVNDQYEHDITSPTSAISTTVHPGTPPGSTGTIDSPHTDTNYSHHNMQSSRFGRCWKNSFSQWLLLHRHLSQQTYGSLPSNGSADPVLLWDPRLNSKTRRSRKKATTSTLPTANPISQHRAHASAHWC
eukprot:scpid93425/ scgid27263/ 